jgi:hypothetical protein
MSRTTIENRQDRDGVGMDVVLGIALTVDSVRLVLVDESDGNLIDQDTFDIDRTGGVQSATVTEHVVNAVLGTYGVAAANGHTVARIAVTWTDDAAEDAGLLVEALGEVGMPNVVAVTGCDAAETFVERMAEAAGETCAAACLIEGSRAPVAYIAVLHATAGGVRRMRSRVVDAADHRQLALGVRGACAECIAEADRVAVFAGGSASGLTGLLAGELNSTLSTQVIIPQDATLAFARGAALTNAGAYRRLHVVGARAAIASGGGAAPPATLAEFTLDGAGGNDFYDVSLVDGSNLPMVVVPQGGGAACGATGCLVDLNGPCPADLKVAGADGAGIACRSACEAFGTPEYCCNGAFGTPATCRPSAYSQFFKNACPRAYSYAYDDATSTFTCASGTASYLVVFCPIISR